LNIHTDFDHLQLDSTFKLLRVNDWLNSANSQNLQR